MRTALAIMLLLASWTPAQAAPRQTGVVVLVIDRSGSMQGPKLEAVKQAAKDAVGALRREDRVAVVAFDTEARVFVTAQKAWNRGIGTDIDRIVAGGGTNIYPGLEEAWRVMQSVKADRKHVILLSDGEAPTDGLHELIAGMRKDKITISTVAIDGADQALLRSISQDGAGRMYEVRDLKTLSQTYIKELRAARLAAK